VRREGGPSGVARDKPDEDQERDDEDGCGKDADDDDLMRLDRGRSAAA
jgi:hypothetical protein